MYTLQFLSFYWWPHIGVALLFCEEKILISSHGSRKWSIVGLKPLFGKKWSFPALNVLLFGKMWSYQRNIILFEWWMAFWVMDRRTIRREKRRFLLLLRNHFYRNGLCKVKRCEMKNCRFFLETCLFFGFLFPESVKREDNEEDWVSLFIQEFFSLVRFKMWMILMSLFISEKKGK